MRPHSPRSSPRSRKGTTRNSRSAESPNSARRYYGFVLDSAPPKNEVGEKKDADKKNDKNKVEKNGDDKAKAEADDEEDEEEASDDSDAVPNLMSLAMTLVGKPKPSGKVVAYSRLHFDLNGNGDLTDDKVVDCESTRNLSDRNYTYATFPPVDLVIEVDAMKVDYAFTMNVHAQASDDFSYVNVSLNAAAYREGEITLDGKKRRVVIVDFNSNGQFNDESTINKEMHTPDGSIYPTEGDRVYFIDPGAPMAQGNPYDISGNDAAHYYVGKVVNFGGGFHDLTISPARRQLIARAIVDPRRLRHESERGLSGGRLWGKRFSEGGRRQDGQGAPARGRVAALVLHDRPHRAGEGEAGGGGGQEGRQKGD